MKYKEYPTPLTGLLGYDTPTIENGPLLDSNDIPLIDLCEMVRNHSLPREKERIVPTKRGARMGIGSYPIYPSDDD